MIPALLLLAAPALAAPAGYTPVTTANDCALSVSPVDAQGVQTVVAECHWAELSVERLDAVLAPWGGHAKIFSAVEVSEVLGSEGGGAKVRQVHVASGISNREGTLIMKRAAITDGFRYSWSLAPTQPAVASGNVQIAKDDGSWTIVKSAKGGVDVTYSLTYNPGGSVPSFVVRWFQSSGVVAITTELRKAAVQ